MFSEFVLSDSYFSVSVISSILASRSYFLIFLIFASYLALSSGFSDIIALFSYYSFLLLNFLTNADSSFDLSSVLDFKLCASVSLSAIIFVSWLSFYYFNFSIREIFWDLIRSTTSEANFSPDDLSALLLSARPSRVQPAFVTIFLYCFVILVFYVSAKSLTISKCPSTSPSLIAPDKSSSNFPRRESFA